MLSMHHVLLPLFVGLQQINRMLHSGCELRTGLKEVFCYPPSAPHKHKMGGTTTHFFSCQST